jgi:hypothetical protein
MYGLPASFTSPMGLVKERGIPGRIFHATEPEDLIKSELIENFRLRIV